jgi:P22_AR N-terminal domain
LLGGSHASTMRAPATSYLRAVGAAGGMAAITLERRDVPNVSNAEHHPIEGPTDKSELGLVKIPFHGDELLVVDVDGVPHVVLKPAIDAIGLDYWSQVEKLRTRSWATTSQCPVVAADGKARDMVTCDVRTFLMLLATIDERRVAKDVAPKLIAYQAEVADAIEAYWTKGGAINPRATDEQLAAIHQPCETADGGPSPRHRVG